MKVLIADNDIYMREALASGIEWEKFGFDTVYLAKNGLEVLSTVQMTPPDLIITEVDLPYLNGIKMIETLRVRNNSIHFIILSARRTSEFLKAAIRLDVFDFIQKPINLNEIEDSVSRVHAKILSERYMLARGAQSGEHKVGALPRLDIELDRIDVCDVSDLETLIEKGNFTEVQSAFERRRAEFLAGGKFSVSSASVIAIELFNAFRREMESLGGRIEDAIPSARAAVREIAESATGEEALELLNGYVSALCDHAKTIFGKSPSSEIDRAKEYIDEHYSNIDLSLNDVAKQINMNPAYFSVLFKKEMGETFINYLTFVRIGKAGELLEKTNMKIYEIAYAVGYDNPTYFSTVFKKNTGLSPQDRRRGSGKII